jgi:hypothetical protein
MIVSQTNVRATVGAQIASPSFVEFVDGGPQIRRIGLHCFYLRQTADLLDLS